MDANTGRVRTAAMLLAAGLTGFAVPAAGCDRSDHGRSGDVASIGSVAPTATGGGGGTRPSDQEIYTGLLAYARCMRSKGVTNFPDPVLGKGLRPDADQVGANTATYRAADDACKALLPQGGGDVSDAPGDRAVALKYSRCMRDNGVPKFPDPKEDGSMDLDLEKVGMMPDNPVFVAALKACAKFDIGHDSRQNGG